MYTYINTYIYIYASLSLSQSIYISMSLYRLPPAMAPLLLGVLRLQGPKATGDCLSVYILIYLSMSIYLCVCQ